MQNLVFGLALYIFLFSPALLIACLISPGWVNKHLKRTFTRKEYIRNLLISTISAFVIMLLAVPATDTQSNEATTSKLSNPSPSAKVQVIESNEEALGETETLDSSIAPLLSPSPSVSPSPSPTPTPTPTPKPTPTPTSIIKTPTPTPYIPPPTSTLAPISGVGNWTCNCSKTCTQITSCAEAYYQLNTCGCSVRDGDNDGIPCEALCK